MIKKVYWYYETEFATSTKSHAYDTDDKRRIGGESVDARHRANGFRKTLCGKDFQLKPTQGETYVEDSFTKIGCKRCSSILAKRQTLELNGGKVAIDGE